MTFYIKSTRFDINSYKPPQATFPAMCQSIKCRTPRRDGELHHWRISFWWLHWSKYINIVKLQAIIALVRHSKELHVAEVINCFHSFLLLFFWKDWSEHFIYILTCREVVSWRGVCHQHKSHIVLLFHKTRGGWFLPSLSVGFCFDHNRLARWSFFSNDGMVILIFQGTNAIDGFPMVLSPYRLYNQTQTVNWEINSNSVLI